MKRNKVLTSCLIASMAMPVSQLVYAQTGELEEIVVTARKRDENIYEIPVSVSAMSGTQLKHAGIGGPEEMSRYVPGLDFQASGPSAGRGNPSIRFRGMVQQSITASTQVGALFWDGSYVGGGGGFLPFADVERVEVIKGPQTAQFGRNTFSGAVNVIPRLPGSEWERNVGVEWSGSHEDNYKLEVGAGGPLNDVFGLRVYAGYEKDGGDFKTQDGEAYGVTEDSTFSGTLTINPTDSLSMKLTGYYVTGDHSGTSVGVDSAKWGVPAGQCDRVYTGEYIDIVTGVKTPYVRDLSELTFSTFCGVFPDGKHLSTPVTLRPTLAQSASGQAGLDALNNVSPYLASEGIFRSAPGQIGGRDRTYRANFSGDYDFGQHTLSFLASYANTGTINRRDLWFGVPNVPGTVSITGDDIAVRENYYEVRVSSPQDQRLRYMLGVSDYDQRYRAASVSGIIDFENNTTTAVFASLDYDLTDVLTLSTEMRYTDEGSHVLIQGRPGQACTEDGGSLVCNAHNDHTDFIPRVILSYQPFDGATAYASYSYSSLLGVPTQCATVAEGRPDLIDPADCAVIGDFTPAQENTQYELGWKQRGDMWAFTAAVFHADWKNQPFAGIVLLENGTTSFRGPGSSVYKGVDLEFSIAPTTWLDVATSLGYVDAEMTKFSSRGSNESEVLGSGSQSVVSDGKRPRNVPALTAAVSPTITGEYGGRDWYVRADWLYTSNSWADYSETVRVPSQTIINLRLGISPTDKYRVELYGRNLADETAFGAETNQTTTGPGGNRKTITSPYQRREFGVRVNVDF